MNISIRTIILTRIHASAMSLSLPNPCHVTSLPSTQRYSLAPTNHLPPSGILLMVTPYSCLHYINTLSPTPYSHPSFYLTI